ncbi:GNAT family N-acetyltransferase [Deinococcus sp. KNUC1210]|uniref:GNAT family N-acetyltransferase n=1 Tax=Deinococcus sp. KNUC1210 TaxID=2917691 RepID=UPI001EF14CCB|nr:GNAT family N-acetyltransferase [Deinococcus sp. KNUC1210]ULH14901.1 GNAT family N-acetyltransferase [Deinococcus sp. KNUC1210]
MPEPAIRPATPADFPAIAEVMNAVWPDQPLTVQGLEEEEKSSAAATLPLRRGRLLAELGTQVVGVAEYTQYAGMYHPQKFNVGVSVHPAFTGQGVGRALSAALHHALAPFNPLSFTAGTQENHPRGLDFLARQGYAEVLRFFDMRLHVPSFDASAWEGAGAMPPGYTLKSLAELGTDDPEVQRRIYELWREVRRDVPRSDPATDMPLPDFARRFADNPYLWPSGYLIAVHDASGEYVATSELWTSDGAHLDTGLTGTRQAHRRHGLGLALKLAAIRVAAAHGYTELRTGNATNNRPMIALNERLGFRPELAWLLMRREFGVADGLQP